MIFLSSPVFITLIFGLSGSSKYFFRSLFIVVIINVINAKQSITIAAVVTTGQLKTFSKTIAPVVTTAKTKNFQVILRKNLIA